MQRSCHGSVDGQGGQTPEILGGGRQRVWVMAAGLGGGEYSRCLSCVSRGT